MAKLKFQRNTHDSDGNDLDVCLETQAEYRQCDHAWVIHLLDRDEGKTFAEVYEEVKGYREQNEEKPDSQGDIALGLIKLVELGLARVV